MAGGRMRPPATSFDLQDKTSQGEDRTVQKSVILVVSAVLFTILAVIAVIVTDLHDRTFPVNLGATSAVEMDFKDSGLSDAKALQQLSALSDQLQLGLVKVTPDLASDGSGQVFVEVGSRENRPDLIRRFGAQPDAEVRDGAALEHSYTSGQYIITGDASRLAAFKMWLTNNQVETMWVDDSGGEVFLFLVRVPAFAISLMAIATLMVSLILYWLSVKAKGRALRVLAGVPIGRIQYEDLGGFLVPMISGALACTGLALVYVGLANGWVFVPYFARALLTLNALVMLATLLGAVVMSMAAWPSAAMLAAREPAVKSLRSASIVLKVVTFTLVLITVAPAFVAFQGAQASSAEQAQWKALNNYVALSFDVGMGIGGFRQLESNVGQLVKDAEESGAVVFSYTWTNEMVELSARTNLEPFEQMALVNQEWLDLMLAEDPGGQKHALTILGPDQVPGNVIQFLGPQLPWWSRSEVAEADILNEMTFYRYAAVNALPLARGGGGDELIFAKNAIIGVVPTMYGTFNDSFLASVGSSRNLLFQGLAPTQALVERNGLQNKVYVRYVAEEGVLQAQLAAYFAWLQAMSLVALVVALIVATLVGAFIMAVLKARRDYPLRLAGQSWTNILGDRVIREWTIGIALAGLVVLLRGLEGGVLIIAVAMVGLILSPVAHVIAANWVFAKVTLRQL